MTGQIRDATRLSDGMPYLPGSSVKGALRTALLSRLVVGDGGRVAHELQGQPPPRNDRDRQAGPLEGLAATRLERAEQIPNRVLFRLLRVSDFVPDPGGEPLELVRVEARSPRAATGGRAAIPIWVLALRPGLLLRGQITLEAGSDLDHAMSGAQRASLHGLIDGSTLTEQTGRWLSAEDAYYTRSGADRPATLEMIRTWSAEGHRWLNLGWGGGWNTKTAGPALRDVGDNRAWEDAVRRARTARRQSGAVPAVFPASRRLAISARGPEAPGWLTVAFAEHRRAATDRCAAAGA